MCAGPVQFFGHNFDDAGEGIESRLGIQEGEAGAAGEDVDSGEGVFMTDGITYFGFNDCEWLKKMSDVAKDRQLREGERRNIHTGVLRGELDAVLGP